MSWQDRDGAPFGQQVWDRIDEAIEAAAAEARAGRRLLRVIGPLGFEARAGVADDAPAGGEDEPEAGDETHVHVPSVRALPVLHRTFRLGARAVEALERRGEPLTLTEAAEAARRIARAEDRLLFEGHAGAGVRGLLEHPGLVEVPAGDWADPGRAGDALLAALTALDDAGRHGPYAAAVSPARFYQLFRPFAGTALTPYQQLLPAFEGGIVKAPGLRDGAVVVVRSASGPQAVVGQELTAAYDGREGIFHLVSLAESVTLLPGAPGSVAVVR
ncbi:family 1 encapsulin nanocompartment shell protein [Anaeromyxobacter dehalogenans]|uniref:Uncharacterized protein linocin/CFP29 n=1 Tax=Anaeromyxobacter dehalogenans (strain 2CP-C) TaxID=290397 RepID=Q2IH48_ANADE|nr:family 1 encapsulin nanocompartment shell protein [Anaeromyxobacter dehalogenans]ABC83903.1 uncharacterized protein linocin/CFP29 [Anaeromyxobacter dehalogenans 2CP-C]